jgi:hypothetical protein
MLENSLVPIVIRQRDEGEAFLRSITLPFEDWPLDWRRLIQHSELTTLITLA